LTRYLRLPVVVPVGLLPDPPFSLLHLDDAATAAVAALDRGVDLAVNVVGEGAVSASQAVRTGRRVPVPTFGPGWLLAKVVAGALGSPLPEHVVELLTRGRTADGALAREVLGVVPTKRTIDVVREMYTWPSVTWLEVGPAGAGPTAAP
jgi:nucleoside-diphosphate-sugar epimerase